jgi:diaminopimelate epimerase
MTIQFDKYQGAGNDFILLDNRAGTVPSLSQTQIEQLCDRHKGIGADGLIIIHTDEASDFSMQYFNADGNESTLCGNGGRCAVAFAHHKKIITQQTSFRAIDGLHTAHYFDASKVELKMVAVSDISQEGEALILDTGSPHYIKTVPAVDQISVAKEGAAIRYAERFQPGGLNVNFVEQLSPTHYKIRTYERGVEGETLACGTGTVAAAIAMHYSGASENANVLIFDAPGGRLKVSFQVAEGTYHTIYLTGPAEFVFSGSIEV